MRMIAPSVLCAVISPFCLLMSNQRIYSAEAPSTAVQRCPENEQYIMTPESGRPSNSWRGLMPLKSTRSDVEALVGKANWSHGSTFIYEMPCGRLDVLYSRGSCELTNLQRWNVLQDVVIRMEFAPRRTLLVKNLNLAARGYTRHQLTHPANWVEYRNKEAGILITALLDAKREKVALITYEPTTKQAQLFSCPSTQN